MRPENKKFKKYGNKTLRFKKIKKILRLKNEDKSIKHSHIFYDDSRRHPTRYAESLDIE